MTAVDLHGKEIDPLRNMFEELSDHFEEKLLTVATRYIASMEYQQEAETEQTEVNIAVENGEINIPYTAASNYNIMINIPEDEMSTWRGRVQQ